MTFDDLWKDLVRKNPGLGDREASVRMPTGMLRRHLERAFEEGRRFGHTQADCGERHDGSRRERRGGVFGDIFGDQLFGGGS